MQSCTVLLSHVFARYWEFTTELRTQCVTLEGDIVATVYDIEEAFSVYMSYEVTSIEQAEKKAEEAACQYLGAEQPKPVKWVKTV